MLKVPEIAHRQAADIEPGHPLAERGGNLIGDGRAARARHVELHVR